MPPWSWGKSYFNESGFRTEMDNIDRIYDRIRVWFRNVKRVFRSIVLPLPSDHGPRIFSFEPLKVLLGSIECGLRRV